jgi:hypothetical protein
MYSICIWTIGLGVTNRIIYMNCNNYETASVLNAGIYQLFLSIWAGYNMRNGTNESIDDSMVGYYVYDTINLLCAPYYQYEYIVHHIVAIYLIYLNNVYRLTPFFYRNVIYFLMELSGCMLNWQHLLHNNTFTLLTYGVYGTTRCIIYPMYLVDYVRLYYKPVWYYKIQFLLLLLLYAMSNIYIILCIKNI